MPVTCGAVVVLCLGPPRRKITTCGWSVRGPIRAGRGAAWSRSVDAFADDDGHRLLHLGGAADDGALRPPFAELRADATSWAGSTAVEYSNVSTLSMSRAACACRLTWHDAEYDRCAVIWGSRGRRVNP